MNPGALQHICQWGMFLTAILFALFSFGSYWFGRQIDTQQEKVNTEFQKTQFEEAKADRHEKHDDLSSKIDAGNELLVGIDKKIDKNSSIPSPEIIEKLKNESMWSVEGFQQGDRRSYLRLLSWLNEREDGVTKDLLTTAIEEINAAYATDVMLLHIEPIHNPRGWWICKESADPCAAGFEPSEGFNAKNVFNHLDRPLWQERGRAASIIRNIRTATHKDLVGKEQLFGKLLDRMNPEKENSLFVAKMALETYKDLTGFSSDGVFDFEGAIKDWEKRKEEILKISF